jgi:hypothetical protein
LATLTLLPLKIVCPAIALLPLIETWWAKESCPLAADVVLAQVFMGCNK